MATGVRKNGEFCWINMLTAKPAEDRTFFGKVPGWSYKDLPKMGGGIINVGGHEVGDTSSHATVFMPAMDIPTAGRMAGIVSPQGVTFYLIRYPLPA